MELLSLPEPAARIWKRAGGALQKALTQTGNPPLRWSIGGGTILARRWQHRESMDIDLTAPAGTGIDRLNERVGGTLKADMTAVGAQQISTGRTRHQVAFDHGSIDIAELDTRPATGATVAVVDGYQVNVKSTTQILRGKFERALRDESPARDLFDVAVAHHADREALACAANMLSEDEVRQIKAHWQINAHRLEREAKQTLANINPEYEPERRQLVERATGRLEDAKVPSSPDPGDAGRSDDRNPHGGKRPANDCRRTRRHRRDTESNRHGRVSGPPLRRRSQGDGEQGLRRKSRP